MLDLIARQKGLNDISLHFITNSILQEQPNQNSSLSIFIFLILRALFLSISIQSKSEYPEQKSRNSGKSF